MDATRWALYTLTVATAIAGVALLYRYREPRGRGRPLLVALRGLGAAIVLLLLFDPAVPDRATAGPEQHILLDGSLSMGMMGTAESSAWDIAVGELAEVAERVLVFGDDVELVPAEALAARSPVASSSRLAPALRAVGEAGGRYVAVWTDGRLDDASEARAVARDLGLGLQVRRIEAPGVVNRGVVELEAPRRARAGVPVPVRVGIASHAGTASGDSVDVVLREAVTAVARKRVPVPGAGRVVSASMSWVPSPALAGSTVRLSAMLASPDAASQDDERAAYVTVVDRPRDVVLVSLEPDWEPRFLARAVRASLGLHVQGYLQTGPERFLPMVGPDEPDSPLADLAEVRRAADGAELLILHHLGDSVPPWLEDAARGAARLLLLPGSGATMGARVTLGAASDGEWYLDTEPPPSPVAGLLTDMDATGLPPLTGLREPTPGYAGWAPLQVVRAGRGRPAPALIAGETDGRRWAVATATGYWRWAFHDDRGRELYQRFWSAVTGWLMATQTAELIDPIRPVARTVQAGQPIIFLAASATDSIRIRLVDSDGTLVNDTTLATIASEARLGNVEPGHYRYEAVAVDDPDLAGRGQVSVAPGEEFTRPVTLQGLGGVVRAPGAGTGQRRRSRPFRTLAWPYVLLVTLLCADWTLRRWWGLR